MDLSGIETHRKYNEKLDALRTQIEKLKRREDKLYSRNSFVGNVLRPFAKSLIPAIETHYGKQVVKKVNQHQTDITFYGPFGLLNERSIVWHFTDGTEVWLHMAQNTNSFSVDIPNNIPNNNPLRDVNGFGKKRINISELTLEQVLGYTHLNNNK